MTFLGLLLFNLRRNHVTDENTFVFVHAPLLSVIYSTDTGHLMALLPLELYRAYSIRSDQHIDRIDLMV